MTTIALAIGLGAVFVGLALAMASATIIGSQRQQVARSLAAVEAIHSAPKAMVEQLDLPFVDRVLGPSKDRFVQLGRRISPAGQTHFRATFGTAHQTSGDGRHEAGHGSSTTGSPTFSSDKSLISASTSLTCSCFLRRRVTAPAANSSVSVTKSMPSASQLKPTFSPEVAIPIFSELV